MGQKVAFTCSYVPPEVISAAGFQPLRLLPENDAPPVADAALPPTVCPYLRQIRQQVTNNNGDLTGLVVTSSCNAAIHFYASLQKEANFFVYLLDLPRKNSGDSTGYYARQIQDMAAFLEERGDPVKSDKLESMRQERRDAWKSLAKVSGYTGQNTSPLPLPLYPEMRQLWENGAPNLKKRLEKHAVAHNPTAGNYSIGNPASDNNFNYDSYNKKTPSILVTGAPFSPGFLELLNRQEGFKFFLDECTTSRVLAPPSTEESISMGAEQDIWMTLASEYLEKTPCPRFFLQDDREEWFKTLISEGNYQGVIFHDLAFCDFNHYDALILGNVLESHGIPFLKIKSELGPGEMGQIQTRIEAFLEMIDT